MHMASSREFVEYVADQLLGAGEITYRKMFGEYGVYCDGKIVALICQDQLFIKITEAGRNAWPGLEEAPPYEGAKPYFLIEELDERERLCTLVKETYRELPAPGPKKKRAERKKNGKEKDGKAGL